MVLIGLWAGCASHPPVKEEPVAARSEPEPATSPGAQFAMLPSVVQRTITAQGGAAEIKDINKIIGAGQDIYEVRFRNPVANPTIYVAEDGTLVNSDGPSSGIAAHLPAEVLIKLHDLAPNAVIADVQARQHTVYEISFKDPEAHPKLVIAEDGTIFKAP